jgi:fibronectin type 3 domain-containing protein
MASAVTPTFSPTHPLDLDAYRQNIQADYVLHDAAAGLQAAFAEAIDKAGHSTDQISEQTRTAVRYAENLNLTEQQLALIGWGNRAAPTPQAAPGQTHNLEIASHGEGAVELHWKAPNEGGKPSSYKIYRRELPDGDWTLVESIASKAAALSKQPRGKPLEYKVVAMNKSGDGAESNMVVVTL